MSTIRKGIQDFLKSREKSSPFLIPLWSIDLESQFIVHEGNVETAEDSNCWTDGSETWAPHRWPYNASSDPNYSDRPLKFSPGAHLSRIGSTWWDWKAKESAAVVFDIDMSDDGHASTTNTVSEKELEKIVAKLKALPYVTLVRSTGGKGIHVYVFFDPDDRPKANNHNEHTQVSFATLAKMTRDAGYDFSQHMDVKGVVFWFWADTSDDTHPGFKLVQKASSMLKAEEIKEYQSNALAGPNRKVSIGGFDDDGQPVESTGSTDGYKAFPLEEEHKRILKDLEKLDYDYIWKADFNMVHTNTRALRELFQKYEKEGHPLRGIFETTSIGHVSKPNCFMTPRSDGSFQVKRFGNGIAEHASWNIKDQDTWCYYNQAPPVSNVLKKFSATTGTSKYIFEAAELEAAMGALGHSLGESISAINTPVTVHRKKDGTFYATCTDTGAYPGWTSTADGQKRTLPIVEQQTTRNNTLLEDIDDVARFLLTPQKEKYGWALKTNVGWIMHPSYELLQPKISTMFGKEATYIKALMAENPWILDNTPFGQEYPDSEERTWNYNSAQLSVSPSDEPGPHPYWDRVYGHLGKSLDEVAQSTEWCQRWGIVTGADYLRFWMASLIQFPFEPLPYLFFYGPQNGGKSAFHESACLIFSGVSVKDAKGALTNDQGFNYEISKTVIGYIEEQDLSLSSNNVYSRLKDWITAKTLTIIKKGETPYSQPNILKLVHSSNSPTAVSVEGGDTRITAIAVALLGEIIPRSLLESKMLVEAPYFVRTLLTTHLPDTHDRLRVPMLASEDKEDLESMNLKPWEAFAANALTECVGHQVKFSEFYEEYKTYCTKRGLINPVSAKALLQLIRGRGDKYLVGIGNGKQAYLANVSMGPETVQPGVRLILAENGRLVKCI